MFVFPALYLCFFNLAKAFPLHAVETCGSSVLEWGLDLVLSPSGWVTSPEAAGTGHSKQLLAEVSSLLWAGRAAQEQMEMPFVKPVCFTQPDFNAAAVISMQVSQIPFCLQGKASLEPLVLLLPWQGRLHRVRKHRVGVVSYYSTQF